MEFLLFSRVFLNLFIRTQFVRFSIILIPVKFVVRKLKIICIIAAYHTGVIWKLLSLAEKKLPIQKNGRYKTKSLLFVGLVKVLQDLPNNYKHKAYFEQQFVNTAEILAKEQQNDG